MPDPIEPTPLLKIDNLTVAYGAKIVLRDVSLKFNGGQLVGLLGPNGAGKSTLIKSILGLTTYSGKIEIEGQPIAQSRRRLAYVPQKEEVRWDFPVSVEDVVMMGRYPRIGWFKRPGKLDKAVVAQSLAAVGMTDWRKQQISQLSGGQQQRVFIARALAQEGDILLLDEPLAGIDSDSQAIITKLLLEIRDAGKLILMATHDLPAASDICDQCALLNRQLIACDNPSMIFQPKNLSEAFGSRLINVGNDGKKSLTVYYE